MSDFTEDIPEGDLTKEYRLLRRAGITDREIDHLSFKDAMRLFNMAQEEIKSAGETRD